MKWIVILGALSLPAQSFAEHSSSNPSPSRPAAIVTVQPTDEEDCSSKFTNWNFQHQGRGLNFAHYDFKVRFHRDGKGVSYSNNYGSNLRGRFSSTSESTLLARDLSGKHYISCNEKPAACRKNAERMKQQIQTLRKQMEKSGMSHYQEEALACLEQKIDDFQTWLLAKYPLSKKRSKKGSVYYHPSNGTLSPSPVSPRGRIGIRL